MSGPGAGRSFVIALVALGALLVSLIARPSVALADDVIRVGVIGIRGVEETRGIWTPTADYLTETLPGRRFEIVPMDLESAGRVVQEARVDFIITQPGEYAALEHDHGITRIATLRYRGPNGQAYTRFGAVIFCRADRADIQGLSDLRGRSLMAIGPRAFGGYQMAQRELLEHGIDTRRDLSSLQFSGFPQVGVVNAVRDGKVDVGTVRTGMLEELARKGALRLDDYRVLGARHEDGFDLLLSTRLYPEWALATLRHTPEALAHEVASALLRLPDDHPAAQAAQSRGWTVPLDYGSIHDTFKLLRYGPYEHYGEVSWRDIVREYWHVMLALTLGVAALVRVTIKVLRLNRKLAQSKQMLEREIAERKRMEQELRVSERMSSLGQLAAGIAHEMNSPLGYVYSNMVSLQGWTRDLFRLVDAYEAAEPELPPARLEAALALKEEISLAFLRGEIEAVFKENREGITRATNIVRDMKVFSHVADGDWQEVDLHDGLRSTLNIVRRDIEAKAEIKTEWGELPRVRCLASQLNQVFLNLLVNARDAVTEGGVITVRTGTEGDRVYIEIADNGAGMAPDVLRRIFDPFFTTKPVGQGTGLGLVVSHRIVAEHGGEILVDSKLGRGTTFRVVIPRTPGEAGAATTTRETREPREPELRAIDTTAPID